MKQMSTLNLLNVDKAAQELDLSPARVRRLCLEGRLGQKVGGRWVVPEDELRMFAQIPRRPGRPPEKMP